MQVDATAGSDTERALDSKPASSVTAPAWVTSDWPVVVVCSLLMLGLTALAGVAYGVVLALIGASHLSLLSGVLIGPFIGFASLGVESAAIRVSGGNAIGFAAKNMPLPFLAIPLAASWYAYRFAYDRVTTERTSQIVFVAKVAVTTSALAGILASVMSSGSTSLGSDGFYSKVAGGTAVFYTFLIVGASGLFFLWRSDRAHAPVRWSQALRGRSLQAALDGAAGFVAVAMIMSALSVVAGVVVADSGRDRLVALWVAPAVALNVGSSGAVVAMGGSTAVRSAALLSASDGSLSSHVSLSNWSFPPTKGASGAPPMLFVLLLLAPLAVGMLTYRRLEREQPTTEQAMMSHAWLICAGFTLASWLSSLVARLAVAGIATDTSRGIASLELSPSPRAALGLALLWSILGVSISCVFWGQAHGLHWSEPASRPAARETIRSEEIDPRPSGSDRTAPIESGVRFCENCGTEIAPENAFCTGCGSRVE